MYATTSLYHLPTARNPVEISKPKNRRDSGKRMHSASLLQLDLSYTT
jgi:hypothetical protein